MSRAGQQQAVQAQASGSGGFDLKAGAIYGVAAWAVGIVLTGVLAWVEFRNSADILSRLGQIEGTDLGQLSDQLPGAVDFVGWLFYNAHFVDVGFSILGQGVWFNFVTGSVSLSGVIAQSGTADTAQAEQALSLLMSNVPTPVWILVPIAVLVVTGYVVASRAGAYDTNEGAKAGASIAIGYLALAVAGTFLFSWTPQVSGGALNIGISFKPQLIMAAGLMGLVYPAVFGGVGGALAAQTTDQPAGRARPAAQPQQGQPAGYQQGGQQPQQGGYQGGGGQAGYQQQSGYQQGGQQPRQGQQYDHGGQQGGHQPAREQRGGQGQDPPRDRQHQQDEQPPRDRGDEG